MNINESMERLELYIVCSYCGVLLKRSGESDVAANTEANYFSHGICPSCLLVNYPKEYLNIQKMYRIRIKDAYKNGYPDIELKYHR